MNKISVQWNYWCIKVHRLISKISIIAETSSPSEGESIISIRDNDRSGASEELTSQLRPRKYVWIYITRPALFVSFEDRDFFSRPPLTDFSSRVAIGATYKNILQAHC